MIRIGVDLGGTKIEAVALDADGAELQRRRVPTPAAGYDSVIVAIRDLVLAVEQEIGQPGSVGIGTPGSVSGVTGRLRNCNSTSLNDRPFAADIGAALGREVRTANDADCFALSEATDGAGAGHRVVFGAILGTGVGGGIVVAQRLWTGRNGVAGEWGHNALPRRAGADSDAEDRAARRCWCGRFACIETYLAGPGLAADHAHHARHAGPLDAAAVVALAGRGEPEALRTMARFHDRLARALASVVNLLDPDVIVLGGGLSNIDAIYDRVPALMAAHVFSDRLATPLVRARHGDSSGVRGAARLWPDAYRRDASAAAMHASSTD